MVASPLEQPDFLRSISAYLRHQDLVHCLYVNNTFYKVFKPLVWGQIALISGSPSLGTLHSPSGLTLEHNKHFIKNIVVSQGYVPPEYLALQGLKDLQSISIDATTVSSDDAASMDKFLTQILPWLTRLIAQSSSTLEKINISYTSGAYVEPSRDLWQTLLACSRLKVVTLHHLSISDVSFSDLLQACAGVEELDLASMSLPRMPTCLSAPLVAAHSIASNVSSHSNISPLGNLRKLTLECTCPQKGPPSQLSLEAQLALIQRCPRLKRLSWSYSGCEPHAHPQICVQETRLFMKGLAQDLDWTRLQRLSTLELHSQSISDAELAAVLRQIYRLVELKVANTGMGPLSVEALMTDRGDDHVDTTTTTIASSITKDKRGRQRRLCDSLETLVVHRCSNMTSSLVQTILTHCSQLKSFYAYRIMLTDVAEEGQEWVCTEMTNFNVGIEVNVDTQTEPGRSMQYRAFKQLSRMPKLTGISLVVWGPQPAPFKSLDLRLDAGMDQLAGLRALRYIRFMRDTVQNMRVEDVQWIVDHFPKLETLQGRVNQDKAVRQQIHEILKSHSVYYDKEGRTDK
ncbi:hypothetical protein EDD11_003066 [Mortierella claussenii]|nr:hypothetical protein EDD11_003066 [Mortierella claussenii]